MYSNKDVTDIHVHVLTSKSWLNSTCSIARKQLPVKITCTCMKISTTGGLSNSQHTCDEVYVQY